ncbi:hypothetical protein M0811_08030 [Anaeramoeba ignava]|uniref:BTB domain-containing protein n=1 Tax=Anaeramoeba ignava TaxID=1746090 RepID=A0A9Q0LP33_ANAIG|nr:hypothetical protein M0811_08030 [Anaeramoeba ignava]
MSQNIYSWGSNFGFSLLFLQSPNIHKHEPTEVTELYNVPIKQISPGFSETVILTQTGNIIEYLSELPIKREPNINNIRKVSSGFGFYACLTCDGEIYLSNLTIFGKPKSEEFIKLDTSIIKEEIIDIACGSSFLLILTESGDAYGVGNSSYGQLGTISEEVPLTLLDSNVKKIFAGNYSNSTFLLKKDNTLFACGRNISNQLGIASDDIRIPKLKQVPDLPSDGIVKNVMAGFYHSIIIIKENGINNIYGSGAEKISGFGSAQQKFEKIPFFINKNEDIKEIAVGSSHSIVLTKSGKLFVFGENAYGCFGVDTSQYSPDPYEIQIKSLPDSLQNYTISAGAFNSFFYSKVNSPLIQDFVSLFENQQGCDISFHTIGGSISAHKLIINMRIGENNLEDFANFLQKKDLEESKSIFRVIYGDINAKIPQKSKIPNFLLPILHNHKFFSGLEKLYHDEESKDFILTSNEKTVKIHKTLLWARSQLFGQMFSFTQDSSNQAPDYSGISFDSLQILIFYLYTNKIPENSKVNDSIIEDLTKAMDYFQLNENEPNLVTKIKLFKNGKNTN